MRIIAPLALAEGALDMKNWHTCTTTHCMAGWAQYAILGKQDSETASVDGTRLLGLDAARKFHVSNDEAKKYLKQFI